MFIDHLPFLRTVLGIEDTVASRTDNALILKFKTHRKDMEYTSRRYTNKFIKNEKFW